jgi:hypothetical protein
MGLLTFRRMREREAEKKRQEAKQREAEKKRQEAKQPSNQAKK